MGLTNPSVMASGIVIAGPTTTAVCAGAKTPQPDPRPDTTFGHLRGLQEAVEVAYQFEGDRT
jgi:hypothetical protein